ncbi:uncharacterized protein LOC141827417 isoform X2 [Curcuma longa]|uniref:uncharacterized protein LOC141827417 isoform X2 n=1 Tax=Curcuma longa TaxID=136217 RepID=UPI003D9EED0F
MLRAWASRPNAHFSAASPLFLFFASAASPPPPSPPSSLASPAPNRRAMPRPLRIAVVGDVVRFLVVIRQIVWEVHYFSGPQGLCVFAVRLLNYLQALLVHGLSSFSWFRSFSLKILLSPFELFSYQQLMIILGFSACFQNNFICMELTLFDNLTLKHDQWDLEQDSRALDFLQADLVLFTGDFGNENVELVRSISNLKLPKAMILGNHDSWTTQTFSEKKTNRVYLQLKCLGEEHVGYSRLDFPTLKLCVLGGRPFSCGGDRLFRPRLLSSRYGVNDMEESAKKICKAACGIPEGHYVIILAHNGPTGLGSNADDICGRDWIYQGGDHGDPDLARAISDLQRDEQIPIPLVVFGHMHNALQYGNGLRKMLVVASDNTIYLNGAIVPRVKDRSSTEGLTDPRSSAEDQNQLQTSGVGTLRAFTVVEMLEGQVEKIVETWVLVADSNIEIGQEKILFQKQ